MNNNATQSKTPLLLWRGTVFFLTDKIKGVNSVFLQASTKEKAEKFVKQRVRKAYKDKKIVDADFKVNITPSCDSEVEVFRINAMNYMYSGLIN